MGMFGRANAALGQWSKAHMGLIPDPSPATAGALADALGGTADMVNQYVANPVLNAMGSSFRFPTGAVQGAVAQPKSMMGRAGRMALGVAIPVPGAQEAGGARAVEEAAQAVRDLKWGPTAGERLIRAQRVLGMHGGVHPEALGVAHQAADELGMPRIDASQTVATPAPALTGDSVLNRPAPRGMIGAQGPRAPVTDGGYMIPGKAYSKAQAEVTKEIAQGPKGQGPLDLSSASGPPVVPQAPIERWQPPRGVSPRLQDALNNNDVKQGILDSMKAGQAIGADKWYHTQPIYEAFTRELGPEAGHKAFSDYMGHVAATSPRSDVSTNIRNASYYYVTQGGERAAKLPQPYGHVAQGLHQQNVTTIEGPGWDAMKNPKPVSFQANLEGNLQPVTVDTHAFRNIGMRTGDPRFLETSVASPIRDGAAEDTQAARYGEPGRPGYVVYRPQQLVKDGRLSMDEAQAIPSFWAAQPNPNEYGAAEQLYTHLGHDLGLAPADAQAAAWAGAGDLTGLQSPPTKTFPELFNERVAYTAKMRGEDPQDTLSALINRQKPLLSVGAGAGAGGLAYGASQDQNR